MASHELPDRENNAQSVVAVHFPGGREFLWVSPDSPVARWQVGESVVFRNSPCVVSERTERDGSLELTLALDLAG
jgi:hypothetical protein